MDQRKQRGNYEILENRNNKIDIEVPYSYPIMTDRC